MKNCFKVSLNRNHHDVKLFKTNLINCFKTCSVNNCWLFTITNFNNCFNAFLTHSHHIIKVFKTNLWNCFKDFLTRSHHIVKLFKTNLSVAIDVGLQDHLVQLVIREVNVQSENRILDRTSNFHLKLLFWLFEKWCLLLKLLISELSHKQKKAFGLN